MRWGGEVLKNREEFEGLTKNLKKCAKTPKNFARGEGDILLVGQNINPYGYVSHIPY